MADTMVYEASHFNIPPSEKKYNVLYLEIQVGCPYNRCNYCKTYRGMNFKNKNIEEVKSELELIINILSNKFLYNTNNVNDIERISRLYLGGADILKYPIEQLKEIIKYAKKRVNEIAPLPLYYKSTDIIETRDDRIKKVAGYATIRSLKNTPKEDLEQLVNLGLNVIYVCLESGSDPVLALVDKNFKQEDALIVAEKIKGIDLMMSINVMPGLGGIKYYWKHIEETVDVLTALKPKWVTLLTVDPKDTEYDIKIKNDPNNRHLTDEEIITQMKEIAYRLDKKWIGKGECNISAHPHNITPISNNPYIFRHKRQSIEEKLLKDSEGLEYWYRYGDPELLNFLEESSVEIKRREDEMWDRETKIMDAMMYTIGGGVVLYFICECIRFLYVNV